jgi:hypothetical protein
VSTRIVSAAAQFRCSVRHFITQGNHKSAATVQRSSDPSHIVRLPMSGCSFTGNEAVTFGFKNQNQMIMVCMFSIKLSYIYSQNVNIKNQYFYYINFISFVTV